MDDRENIQAVYENGVFRPETPVALPEHTRVQISIHEAPEAPQEDGVPTDLNRFSGTVAPREDAAAFQRRIRGEWA